MRTTHHIGDLAFDFDAKARVLSVTMPPEKYWPIWEEYRRAPAEEHDKGAQETLHTIAVEAEKMTKEHGLFTICVQTVHMGAEAMLRAIPE